MTWIHEVSQSMLAGAVVALGLVIMLELRSIMRLRRLLDGHLARVFEQLDLLRYENQQLLEAQPPVRRPPAAPASPRMAAALKSPQSLGPGAAASAATAPRAAQRTAAFDRSTPQAEALAPAPAATTGEVRLLASLAAARARRELAQRPSTIA